MSILIFLAVLSILVVVHEFGHFLAARMAGVKVEKFAVGFGKPLLKIKWQETDFLICIFPLGGYVKMAGDVRPEFHGESNEFFSKPLFLRAGIVFFGPLFNLLLACLIFWIIFIFTGFPSSKPTVGEVIVYGYSAKSEFSQEQLQKLSQNRIVVEDDGKENYVVWIQQEIKEKKLASLNLPENSVKHILGVWEKSFRVTPKNKFTQEELQELLNKHIVDKRVVYWNVYSEEELKNKLQDVSSGEIEVILSILRRSYYPAYAAGIKEGDVILEVNSQAVTTWGQMSKMIKESKDKVKLTLLRGSDKKEIEIIPQKITVKDITGEKEISLIGIGSQREKGNIITASIQAGQKVYFLTKTFIQGISMLISKRVPFKEAVSGPIGIGVITAKIAKIGFLPVFDFMGILSLNLAIINLLPFPVLDGGHLLFMFLEKLRKKPLSQKWEDLITQTAIGILIALMVIVSYNDILKFGFKKYNFTKEELQILKTNKLIDNFTDDRDYIFWNILNEGELTPKLSGMESLNQKGILEIWRNSSKITRVNF